MAKQRVTPRQTCTYHCATCDAHFHSLEAFDYHRPGECNLEARSERSSKLLLEKWTETGYCALAKGHNEKTPQHPVTIYTRAGLSHRRQALAARRGEG